MIFIQWNRSLQYASSKLKCLEILHQLCPHLVDEIILDRILPYIVRTAFDSPFLNHCIFFFVVRYTCCRTSTIECDPVRWRCSLPASSPCFVCLAVMPTSLVNIFFRLSLVDLYSGFEHVSVENCSVWFHWTNWCVLR